MSANARKTAAAESSRTALVIANGLLPAPELLSACAARADLIICADGGANRALAVGLRPHYVVGDFDSVTTETRRALAGTPFIHRPSQYATDLEKTLAFALEQHIHCALLVGITGFRLDHQLVNLNIAEKFCSRIGIEICDDYGTGSFICAESAPVTARFASFAGQQISLIAFRRACRIVSEGLKYPLRDEELEWAARDGLSNEARADTFAISVGSGNLFCYRVR